MLAEQVERGDEIDVQDARQALDAALSAEADSGTPERRARRGCARRASRPRRAAGLTDGGDLGEHLALDVGGVLAALVLVAALLFVFMAVRRRLFTRGGGTVECSLRELSQEGGAPGVWRPASAATRATSCTGTACSVSADGPGR